MVWDLGSRVRRERKSGNALRTAGPFKTTKCSNGSLRLLCDERIDCCKRRRRGDGGWMQHSSGGWYTTRGKVEKKTRRQCLCIYAVPLRSCPKITCRRFRAGQFTTPLLPSHPAIILSPSIVFSSPPKLRPSFLFNFFSLHCAKTHGHDKLAQPRQQVEQALL